MIHVAEVIKKEDKRSVKEVLLMIKYIFVFYLQNDAYSVSDKKKKNGDYI